MSSQTKPPNKNFLLDLLFCLLFFLSFNSFSASVWQELAPGIEYRDLKGDILNPWSHVHIFLIDLQKNQLELLTAKNLALKNASADQFAQHSKALISINGGFFDHEFTPLGLRINNKKIEHKVKKNKLVANFLC